MDLFLVASTPLLRLGIHTCTLSLLKTSLFCVFLFFQDGGQSQGSVRCGLQSRGTPCPPPPESSLLSFVSFSSCWHPFKTGRRGKARGAPGREWTQSVVADTAGTTRQPTQVKEPTVPSEPEGSPEAQTWLEGWLCHANPQEATDHRVRGAECHPSNTPKRAQAGGQTPHLPTFYNFSTSTPTSLYPGHKGFLPSRQRLISLPKILRHHFLHLNLRCRPTVGWWHTHISTPQTLEQKQ